MTTLATLRSRVYARTGIVTASAQEELLTDEAINAAIARVAGEGAPQLRQTYVGTTLSDLSTTVSAHTANTASVTLASATGVFPGDILTVTSTSTKYIIRTVAGSVLDMGGLIASSINGLAVTVTRRTFPLPHSGTIWEVTEVDGRQLKEGVLVSGRAQFETGTACYWTQTFSTTGAQSLISFYPAPTSATQFILVQGPGFAEDADVYMSPALLEVVISQAVQYRMLMGGNPTLAGMAGIIARHVEGLRVKSSGGPNLVTRP